jgi:hypothetical protein
MQVIVEVRHSNRQATFLFRSSSGSEVQNFIRERERE